MTDRIKPTRQEIVAILLIGLAMVPMICLGIYIQASVLDPWFVSEEEIESLLVELNRQDMYIFALEQEQKKLRQVLERLEAATEETSSMQQQPVADAIQRYVWRERIRNWGR